MVCYQDSREIRPVVAVRRRHARAAIAAAVLRCCACRKIDSATAAMFRSQNLSLLGLLERKVLNFQNYSLSPSQRI